MRFAVRYIAKCLLRSVALALCLVDTNFAQAAERWICVRTSHFEMYTSCEAKQARQMVEVFERVRLFFLQAGTAKNLPETPVKVIAFQSEAEFAPYRLNGHAIAFYQRSHQGDLIVLQDLEPVHRPVAIHEYTHLVISHSRGTLPLWLNEGLAEFYASLLTGQVPQAYLEILNQKEWLRLSVLLTVESSSPLYNSEQESSILYAQSWLLTRMLATSSEYGPAFPAFLHSLRSGDTAEQSFTAAYGKSLAQVEEDLLRYPRAQNLVAMALPRELPDSNAVSQVESLSLLKKDLALANLLASHQATAEEGKQELQRIAAQHPQSAEAAESLGYLASEEGRTEEAQTYFARAAENGSCDPEILYRYALKQKRIDSQAEMKTLRKALEVNPDFDEARLELGLDEMQTRQYKAALTTLLQLRSIDATRAFPVFYALAYCSYQLHSPAQARSWGQRAMNYASSTGEFEQINNLLHDLAVSTSFSSGASF
jgi:tetratricopeptide (TPR) repeat protein